ncbi:MAG TPA: cupin domain-containing protein [Methylomirabilota bacterium]|nr:cupin domain-containing protein [Methylomirabilota bacterium]
MKYIVRASDVPPYSPPLHAGTVNRRLVGRDVNGSTQVEMVLGTLEPGGVAERHSHDAQEQALYILEGRALVEVGDSIKEEVGPGTACFFPAGMPHRFEALTPVRALVIYAPPLERSTSDMPFRPA